MTKRLRIFAGPNGSGKTTLYNITKGYFHQTIMVNADEIEKELQSSGSFSFRKAAHLPIDKDVFLQSFQSSTLFDKAGGAPLLSAIHISDDVLSLSGVSLLNSYFTAYIAEYIRYALIKKERSLSFETVMSDARKLDFIRYAKEKGYKVYLYFITTVDPQINIDRVALRMERGGHSVPEDKIRSRYTRSLDNLYEAMKLVHRSFIFDNSSENHRWIAESEDEKLILRVDQSPAWFREYVLDKIAK
jgi:predicted ABC-type ATPase